MTDNRAPRFDADLVSVLRQIAGPGAPASLRYRLADVTAEPPMAHRAWFTPLLGWAGAAAVVVALVALAVLFVPRGNVPVGPVPTASQSTGPAPSGEPSPSANPSASQPASPSTSPSPTATPSASQPSPSPTTPSATPPPPGWTSLTWSKAVGMADGQFLSDLVVWGGGYVGVGGIETSSGMEAAFFTSADGTHWKLVARKTVESSELAGLMASHVARIGNRLIAIGGAVMNAPGAQPDVPAPLWVSGDGVSWSRVQAAGWDGAFASRWPARLIATSRGAVALTEGADPIVLFSADGSAWTRATLPVMERAVANDAVGASSGFVIVGRDGQPGVRTEVCDNTCPPPGIGRPAAWTSVDGVRWSEATVEGDRTPGAGLSRVIAGHAGLIAFGVSSTADYYDTKTTTWTSADARSWSIADGLQLPAGLGPYPVLAGDGERALVLGGYSAESTVPAWTTADDVTWARLAYGAAGSPPVAKCPADEECVRVQQAWLVPDGIIVAGTPGPLTPQTFWLARGS